MSGSALSRPGRSPRRLADVAALVGAALPSGAGDVTVTGVCLDSRAVRPGDVYAGLPGAKTHGGRFAADAAAAGAVAVLTDPDGALLAMGAGLPTLVVPDPRGVLGGLAAWVWGEPARHLLMLGVTGTNGKTTTTFLLDGALRHGGRRTGLVGTVETRIGDERLLSVRTTPEATDVHALLARMVDAGVTACSMEVSSHALALHRVDGIVFDVAGYTNLSQDHLDFHATMDGYFAAKAQLFTPARSRCGVVCVDDVWGRRLAAEASVPVVTLATAGSAEGVDGEPPSADWVVTSRQPDPDGTGSAFTLRGPDGATVTARCPLPGDFNVANTALALVMLVQSGVPAPDAAAWLAGAGAVPGRMERVPGPGAPGEPVGIVDYAHTPDAVSAALTTLRGLQAAGGGRLVVVLGAGGDRDREKRPRMGAAAACGADVVIVTDDNPRSEDPAVIRAAVMAGARQTAESTGAVVLEEGDRAAAVAEGVRQAWGGGVLLVAGKGHERGQEVAGQVHPFDDRSVLADALRAVSEEGAAAVSGLRGLHDGVVQASEGRHGLERPRPSEQSAQ